jgi:hypothetical protein
LSGSAVLVAEKEPITESGTSGRLKGRKAGSKTLYTQEELDEIFPK